jgi:hypothetical protein
MWMRKLFAGAALAALLLTAGCCCKCRRACRPCDCPTTSGYEGAPCECGTPAPGPTYMPAAGPLMPPAKP